MIEWISIKKQLPPDCEDILLYSKEEGILKGAFHTAIDGESIFVTECFRSHKHSKPTHWMRIPQPPKD